jgi:hypothetical protein
MGENTTPRDKTWRGPHPVHWIYWLSGLMIMDFWLSIRILLFNEAKVLLPVFAPERFKPQSYCSIG